MEREKRSLLKKLVVCAIVGALLMGTSVLVLGKGKYQGPEVDATLPRGGTLQVSLETKLENLDPQYSGGPNIGVWANIFEGMLYKTAEGEIKPALAESWEWIDDTHLRFRLRKGVKFHSGKEMTAEDVAKSYARALDPKNTYQDYWVTGPWLKPEVLVEDKYTVVMQLKKPFPQAIDYFADLFSYSVLDFAVLEKYGDMKKNPSGTGPFKFVEWVPGQYVKMQRFDDYWGGAPPLDYLIFKYIPEPASQVLALKKGEIDVLRYTPPDMLSTVEKDPNIKVNSYLAARSLLLEFNFRRQIFGADLPQPQQPKKVTPGLDTPKPEAAMVRKAISLAIDTASIAKNIVGAAARPSYSYMLPATFGNYEYGFPEYNPELAKALLKAAGWVDTNKDGIVDKNGKPFKITVVTDIRRDYRNQDVAVAIKGYLREVGIDVKPVLVERSQYVELAVNKGDFDLLIMGYPCGPMVATWQSNSRFHSDGQRYGTWGTMRHWRKDLDTLVKQAGTFRDPKEAAVWWQLVQMKIYNETLAIPLYWSNYITSMRKNVMGFVPHPNEHYQYRYNNVWIKK
jgi:peptide/nickel transport system substrate-binding protein